MQRFSPYSTLQQHGSNQSDVEALVLEDRVIRYGELLDRVTALAGWLLRNGLTPGEVTGLCIRGEIDHLVSALALLCLGTPQISLGSHEAGTTRRALASKVGVTQLIVEKNENWMEGRKTLVVPLHNPKAFTVPSTPSTSVFPETSPDAICVYQNTSGSTNIPKTFGLTVQRLQALTRRYCEDLKERRVLRTGSIEFDAHRLSRICALLAGNTCVFLRHLNLRGLVAVCEQAAVSNIHMGAYKLASLIQAEPQRSLRLPPFTAVQTGGSRVPGRLRKELKDALTENLWVLYATSEVGTISMAPPDQHDSFPEGVGFPAADVTVEIVGSNGEAVEPGEIGQIRVRKSGMARQYIAESRGASNFEDGWFYPRDLVSWREGEPLIFHGRSDDVMILNGINVYPSAIEDTLESHPDVKEAVAYPIRSRVHGEIPVAAVILRDGAPQCAISQLTQLCRDALGIRAPRQIFIVDRIPRNAVGKPLKRELTSS